MTAFKDANVKQAVTTDGNSRLDGIRGHVGQMLDDLHDSVDFDAVRAWLNRNPVDTSFADVIFGTIKWPKALGRPSTPSLSEGFQAIHQWTDPEKRMAPGGGTVTVYKTVPDPAPILVDGPAGPDEYRVSFVDRFEGQLYESIVVAMNDVRWRDGWPFEGVREIQLVGGAPQPDRHATASLPTEKTGRPIFLVFEVVIKTILARR